MRFFKYLLIFSFLYISSFQNTAAQIHWESMVLESDTWKYLAATAEPARKVVKKKAVKKKAAKKRSRSQHRR